MSVKQKITTFLWFDGKAEEAATHYTSIFENSKILGVARYGEAGPGPKGSVMTVSFQLEGREFVALNGGPLCRGCCKTRTARKQNASWRRCSR